MQRPPDRKPPAILFTRATSEWINRVTQKHKQLAELKLSAAQTEKLDRWAESEFVYSAFRLEGREIEPDEVARLVSNPGIIGSSASERAALALLDSLRTVTAVARASGRAAELSVDLLI